MNGDLLGRMLTGAARMGMAGWQAQQQGQQPGQQPQSPQPIPTQASGGPYQGSMTQPMTPRTAPNPMLDIRRALAPPSHRPMATPPSGRSGGTPPQWGPMSPLLRALQRR